MRINKIQIYGFGGLRDVEWTLEEGINLIEGNNEAGKTTLMAFIRAVLFGFEKRNQYNPETRYEPLDGGTFGGALEVYGEDGNLLRIERVYRKKAAGDVTVSLPDGKQADEAYLQRMLGGISDKVFKNVFAFGLGELQQFESLKQEEINQFIYTAGTGDGPAIVKAQKVLSETEQKLFLPTGHKPELNALLKETEEVHKEWNRLKKETLEYDEWAGELRQMESRIAEREKEVERLRGLLSWQEKLHRQYEAYEQYISLENQLRALPEVDVFPENGSARLEELQKNIGYIEAELAEYREKIRLGHERKVSTEKEMIRPLLERRLETEDLRDHLNGYREYKEQLNRCENELAREEERIGGILGRLGSGWTEEKVEAFDCSHGIKHVVASFRQELADLREEEKAAEQQQQADRLSWERKLQTLRDWKARQPSLFSISLSLSAAEKEQAANDILERHREALDNAKNLYQQLKETDREIAVARDKIGVYQEYSASFSGNGADHLDNRRNKGGAVKWLFAAASVVVPALLLLAGQPPVYAGIAFFLFALGAFLQIGVSRLSRHGNQSSEFAGPLAEWKKREAEAEEHLRQLERQRIDLEDRARKLAGNMNPNENPSTNLSDQLLSRWEKQYEDKREQWQVCRRWSQQLAEKEMELLQAEELRAKSEEGWKKKLEEHAAHKETWLKWLQEHGIQLPVPSREGVVTSATATASLQLSPEIVQDMIRDVESGKEAMRRKNDLLKERERLVAFIKDYEEKQRKVVEAVNADRHAATAAAANSDPIYLTSELNRLLEENKERETLVRNLAEKTAEQEEQARGLERRLKVEYDQLQKLLNAAGTDDPEEFRRLEGVSKIRRQLATERNQIYQSFCAMLANSQADGQTDDQSTQEEVRLAQFFRELSEQSKWDIAEKLNELQGTFVAIREEVNHLRDRKGELQAEMKRLASGEELSAQAHLYHQKISDLQEKAKEWATVVICRYVMQQAMRVYETEKQPAVLKKASSYLQEITEGRYVRVLAPIGEAKIEVERQDGRRLEPGFLSRGTVEQLYLAMRFALVDEYGGHALLPMVLDDIFVNFDPVRTQAAVRTLTLLAEHRQILYFTCHPHVRELFAKEQAEYRHIKLSR